MQIIRSGRDVGAGAFGHRMGAWRWTVQSDHASWPTERGTCSTTVQTTFACRQTYGKWYGQYKKSQHAKSNPIKKFNCFFNWILFGKSACMFGWVLVLFFACWKKNQSLNGAANFVLVPSQGLYNAQRIFVRAPHRDC